MVGCRDSSNLFLIQFTEVAHELEKGPDRIVGISVVSHSKLKFSKYNHLNKAKNKGLNSHKFSIHSGYYHKSREQLSSSPFFVSDLLIVSRS